MASIQPICCTEKYMYKGDHRTFRVTVKNAAGAAVNLTGCVMKWTLKQEATDALYVVQKTSANVLQIAFTVPASGIAEIYLVPADTAALAPGHYVYDIELTTLALKVYTLTTGTLILQQDVTFTPTP